MMCEFGDGLYMQKKLHYTTYACIPPTERMILGTCEIGFTWFYHNVSTLYPMDPMNPMDPWLPHDRLTVTLSWVVQPLLEDEVATEASRLCFGQHGLRTCRHCLQKNSLSNSQALNVKVAIKLLKVNYPIISNLNVISTIPCWRFYCHDLPFLCFAVGL